MNQLITKYKQRISELEEDLQSTTERPLHYAMIEGQIKAYNVVIKDLEELSKQDK